MPVRSRGPEARDRYPVRAGPSAPGPSRPICPVGCMPYRSRVGAMPRNQGNANAATDVDRHFPLQIIGL